MEIIKKSIEGTKKVAGKVSGFAKDHKTALVAGTVGAICLKVGGCIGYENAKWDMARGLVKVKDVYPELYASFMEKAEEVIVGGKTTEN